MVDIKPSIAKLISIVQTIPSILEHDVARSVYLCILKSAGNATIATIDKLDDNLSSFVSN